MTALEQLKKRHEDEIARFHLEKQLVGELPTMPTISNLNSKFLANKDVTAWFSFTCPSYDPDNKWNPVKVLQDMEEAGWEVVPTSRVKWDNYRECFEPGLCDDIVLRGTYKKLTSKEPILPYWVEPCQFTKPDFNLYMKRNDKTVRVCVHIPGTATIHARRIESIGDWYYERGTCTVGVPPSWHKIDHVDTRSKGYVDTEKGISGRIWFTSPDIKQDAWKMKASEFLTLLLAYKVQQRCSESLGYCCSPDCKVCKHRL